jgi:hypothetical protein
MAMLESYYNGTHRSEDGESYTVLDMKRLYDAREQFVNQFSWAQRSEPVYVWRPKAGDAITESGRAAMTAKGGETVFLKKLDAHGKNLKIYIPSGSDGPLNASALDEKYNPEIPYEPREVNGDPILKALPEGATVTVRPPKRLPVPILHEVIDRPTVVLNARGQGKHQYMQLGDSLKFEDGECLPLPKAELATAWNVQLTKKRGIE